MNRTGEWLLQRSETMLNNRSLEKVLFIKTGMYIRSNEYILHVEKQIK